MKLLDQLSSQLLFLAFWHRYEKWKQGADGAVAEHGHKSRSFISYIKINVYSVLLAAPDDIHHFQ